MINDTRKSIVHMILMIGPKNVMFTPTPTYSFITTHHINIREDATYSFIAKQHINIREDATYSFITKQHTNIREDATYSRGWGKMPLFSKLTEQ